MCSGRSKNGCLYITFPRRLRPLPLAPVPLAFMADSGTEGGSEASCDNGGAGIRRTVLQFKHKILINFLCEGESAQSDRAKCYSMTR